MPGCRRRRDFRRSASQPALRPAGFLSASSCSAARSPSRRSSRSRPRFEQSTRRRRPPPDLPWLAVRSGFVRGLPAFLTLGETISFDVTATGTKSVPPSDVPFTASARFTFNSGTRQLRYDITLPAASLDQIAGVYLHRRTNRPNGGVAHILAKSAAARVSGSRQALGTGSERCEGGEALRRRGQPAESASQRARRSDTGAGLVNLRASETSSCRRHVCDN